MSDERVPYGFTFCPELSASEESDGVVLGNLESTKVTRIISKPRRPSREGEEFLADVANLTNGLEILCRTYVPPRNPCQGSRSDWYPAR